MLNKLFVLTLSLVLLTSTALAVSLRDIDINPEEIDLEDTFYVEVTFSGDTCGTEVKFFMDDKLFSSKIVGCNRDSIESREWDLSDNPLDCGKHILRVELIKDDKSIDNITQEIEIGNQPLIIMPERPLVNKEFTIHFEDSDTGKPADNIRVEIYDLRKGRKEKVDYYTDINGDIIFKSSNVGEFKLIIDDPEYCGSRNFYVKKTLNIDGPYPAAPLAGELITIAVPGGVGVKVLDEYGNIYATGSTTIGGGVNLTIDDPGNYTLVIGELSNTYWGRNVSIRVSEKLKPSIIITPEKAIKDKELILRVKVNNEPLEYADVTIQKPVGDPEEYKTDKNGELKFTPFSTGKFLVKVEKRGYKACERAFEVRNLFNIEFTPKEPKVDEDITLFVRDQLNNLVQGATVSISDAVSGISGLDGRFTFRLTEPGEYTVIVTKPDYWDLTQKMVVLSPLHLELSSEKIELGESISAKVLALGKEISADIEVIKPDGEKESIGESYKPEMVGSYEIIANKDGYISANKTLIVNPHPLNLNLELIGDRLSIKVTSHEKPVSGISMNIEKPTGIDELVTDDEGKVETKIKKEGEVKISANVINTNPDYDKILVSRNIIKKHNIPVLILAISAIVLVAIIAIAVVHTIPRKEKKEKKKKKRTGLKKGKRSTLSRL